MKRTIYVLLAASCMSQSVYAQKTSSPNVPANVTSSFHAKYPEALKTNWEVKNQNEYEAEFKMNNVEYYAQFDGAGHWIETETKVKFSDLPSSIQAALCRDFADYKTSEARKIESAVNGNCFEAEVKKGKEEYNLLFSSEGEILSKKKSDDEAEEKD